MDKELISAGLEPEGNPEPESVDGTATHPPIGTDIAEMDVQLNTRDLSVVLWYSEDEPPTGASSDSGSFCAPVSILTVTQLDYLMPGKEEIICLSSRYVDHSQDASGLGLWKTEKIRRGKRGAR